MIDRTKAIAACAEIAKDMERDARDFEGKPFTGRNVGTQFGNQGAAIAALANIVAKLLEEKP